MIQEKQKRNLRLGVLGIREMKALLKARCQTGGDRKMSCLFDIGAIAGTMGFLFIHIMCCFVAIIFKCAYAAGMDFAAASALTNTVCQRCKN